MREQRPNKLNNQQAKKLEERLKVRRRTGETLSEIGRAFGITAAAVQYHERKLPPAIRFKPAPRRQVDEAEVLRLYGVHMSVLAVARDMGITHQTVSRILARMEWKAAA